MSITLRHMTPDDIELGMRLKQQAGWNQTRNDWQRFLRLEPDGCFVAQWQDHAVATTTTCVFGSIGWIAMVLVDERFRHRGIASQLVERALHYLAQRSVVSIRLDATDQGKRVYQRLGFMAGDEFIRFCGNRPAHLAPIHDEATRCSIDTLAELDQTATNTDRRRLIEQLVYEFPNGLKTIDRGDSVDAFVLVRPGSEAVQIGPAVARHDADGAALFDWAWQCSAAQKVMIDIPAGNRSAVRWARSHGLQVQRRFNRMCRGQPISDRIDLLWASSGPEKG